MEEKNEPVKEDEAKEEFLIPINTEQQLKPFIDRYFIKYIRQFEESQNHFAFLHSNNLFLVGLTKEHSLVREQDPIK